MEFREVIARRRMVRNYTDEPVSAESVERIVDVAFRAPSAGYSQGVAVVVVTDPERRREIAELAGEPDYLDAGYDPWISGAPVHVVLCVSEQAYHDRYHEKDKLGPDGEEIEWPVPYWWVDSGAALMAVLLAAVDEGLAAGFLGTHVLRELGELLDLPAEQRPIGIVTIGHPAPDRRSGSLDRGKRQKDEVVHREAWGS